MKPDPENRELPENMYVYLHVDNRYSPDQWYKRFEFLLKERYKVKYQLVDLLQEELPEVIERVGPQDCLLGRFGHIPDDLKKMKPVYQAISNIFNGRTFPKQISYQYYDDKSLEIELFKERGYPIPISAYVSSQVELQDFIGRYQLSFPIVVKSIHGAGSSGVRLCNSPEEISFPCLVQEFCTGNDGDYRIIVIGHRVMGYKRLNRDDDFRASGSGKIVYVSDFDPELIRLAYKISCENGFDSMAYDFVKLNGQWVVLEMSYCYVDYLVRDCRFYYDMRTMEKVPKLGIYPQDFILEDFFRNNYGLCLRKPKVLLIADVPGWIFERHCKTIRHYLSDEFDFSIKFRGELYDENEFDLIYPLEWHLVEYNNISNPTKYITGIRSHFIWEDGKLVDFTNELNKHFSIVHVVSKRLLNIFAPFIPRITYVSHGVDTNFFSPTTICDQSGKTVRLGWAGNRRSGGGKGFAEIIEPLARIPGVELVFCGYSDKNLTLEEMRDFYNSIDIYVCASLSEGNNNSLLEASAMERAIITTDNGTVPEYLENGVNALIVKRELSCFIEAVEYLRDHPEIRREFGKAARLSVVERWSWEHKAQEYRSLFWQGLAQSQKHGNGRHRAKIQENLLKLDLADYVHKADQLTGEGRIDEAIDTLQICIEVYPQEVAVYKLLCILYTCKGDLKNAEVMIRVAIRLESSNPELLNMYGTLLYQQGRYADSKELFERAFAFNPESEEIQQNLAYLLEIVEKAK